MQDAERQKKQGVVIKKIFGEGSKSSHMAYYLITEDKEQFVLRRKEANPFADNFFESYLNKKVLCKGTTRDYIFFISSISEIEK